MKNKFKDTQYWLSLFIVMAFYCFGISNILNANNTTYALEQINAYDGRLFADNLAVCKEGMSARFFMNFIVGLGMKLSGGNWSAIGIPLIYTGVIVLSVATVETVFNFTNRYRVFLTIVFAFLLRHSINTGFPGWGSFELTSIGIGTAYAFTMLALSQVAGKEKRWNVTWMILSIAALCHVHEGIWGFCLIFLIYVGQSIREKSLSLGKELRKKQWAFFLFVIVMGICVIPGIRGEASGLTSAEFVNIYAYYRTPHHLVPSAWGWGTIAKYFLLIFGSAFLRFVTVYFTDRGEEKNFIWEAGLVLGSWFFALLVEYIFVEIVPTAFVVTMFIPKFFKYIGILSQIWCVRNLYDWIGRNEYLIAGVSLVTVCAASQSDINGIVILYGITVSAIWLWKKCGRKEMQYLLPAGVLVIAVQVQSSFGPITFVLMIFSVYLVFLWENDRWLHSIACNTVFVSICSVLLLVCAGKGRIWELEGMEITHIEANSYLERAVGRELYDLAVGFEKTTGIDEEFLTDPNEGSSYWFQLAARRNCYVTAKNVPAAQSQIKEWYRRILKTEKLFQKTVEEIATIMNTEGIDYILVKSDYYGMFDGSDIFRIVKQSVNDQYRLYRLGDQYGGG